MTEHVNDNHGIVIGGQAYVSDSALAVGEGAKAVYGARSAEEVRRQLAEFRAVLEQQGAQADLAAHDLAAVEEATQAVDDELAAEARPGRLRALTARLREVSAALAGAGALAQAAGQLQDVVHGFTG